jgi:N-acylneuraminate cytidylyltransferase
MPNIAIIPARGGSKRIPRKNIKFFLGKPIIAYSIEAAINSNLFDEVMVSTDDDEIASIALKYGAKVPFLRSEKNSDDFATTYEVIEETLINYKKQGKNFDYACCIYSCAPLIQIASLQEAFTVLKKNILDTVFPVVPFSFPIQRALRLKEEKLSFFHPEFALTRSQDLEFSYHDVGQFYFMNCEEVLKKKALLTDKTGTVVLDELLVQDIDNESDWMLAEFKYKIQILNEKI